MQIIVKIGGENSMNIKKFLKRNWEWYGASESIKDYYIKKLAYIINLQNNKIAELETRIKALEEKEPIIAIQCLYCGKGFNNGH